MRPEILFASSCSLCKESFGDTHYILDDSTSICHNCYLGYGSLVDVHVLDSYKRVEKTQFQLMRGT